MASVKFAIPNEVKLEMKTLAWVNWFAIVREESLNKEELLSKLESKEEKELTKWSVELGRKAKKGRFKRLLAELSPEKRKELLKLLES